jgi:GNAT superfamily N-acetyltransferase
MTLEAGYTLRDATLADIPTLVRHRLRMFEEMGVDVDAPRASAAFTEWLRVHLPAGTYRAWVVNAGEVAVAGAGVTIVAWPPGPWEASGRLPIVFNVYTEPAHRRHGLARGLMRAIHAWCRDTGYRRVGLAASADGQPLYESLGYRESPQPYMFLDLPAE